mmetsp:Transcript_4314/g.9824  ORF Transcript_4314/g.9824 Transcript_4314/m.9824 type:complete len:257 (+) Transcript_4314:560-1330(+)
MRCLDTGASLRMGQSLVHMLRLQKHSRGEAGMCEEHFGFCRYILHDSSVGAYRNHMLQTNKSSLHTQDDCIERKTFVDPPNCQSPSFKCIHSAAPLLQVYPQCSPPPATSSPFEGPPAAPSKRPRRGSPPKRGMECVGGRGVTKPDTPRASYSLRRTRSPSRHGRPGGSRAPPPPRYVRPHTGPNSPPPRSSTRTWAPCQPPPPSKVAPAVPFSCSLLRTSPSPPCSASRSRPATPSDSSRLSRSPREPSCSPFPK